MVVLTLVSVAHPNMTRALELAALSPFGENPRVGCVITDASGVIVGEGFHHGAGHPHAEVEALKVAGARARGGSAYVTLEPCAHTGRTGPCTSALIEAGVARVIYGQFDPNPIAKGGAQVLRDAGLDVLPEVLADRAFALNREWSFAVAHGRPFVTLKLAASLDGRVANADGSPRQLTGAVAAADVHELRSRVGAIMIGAGTAIADNPRLTARTADGALASRQPIRVVMAARTLPQDLAVFEADAPTLIITDQNPHAALARLYAEGVRHVLLEGGPTLAGSFLEEGLVDEVWWYCAPITLGSGPFALAGVEMEFEIEHVHTMGEDLKLVARVRSRR